MLDILAISGSLRKGSSNTALLKAAAKLAPPNSAVSLFDGLGSLPLFNPDLEGYEPPSVIAFRTQLQKAKGVLIASPEYAHGVTGVLKNALDWVVGSGEFVNKPIALLNASSRSTHAQGSLKEIITTMDARVIAEASLVIPLPNNKIDEEGILADLKLSALLRQAVIALTCAML